MSAKILIVDDLESNIKLLEAKLTNNYYEVFTASNGFDALKILDYETIDIILLDVMMPEIDGFQICRRIKANPKTSNIPVIMVTALSGLEDRIKGLNAGADDFITKPIVDVSLFARIRSYTRLKSLIDEIYKKGEDGIQFIESHNEYDCLKDANVLLIDDDLIQCNSIKSILKSSNITEVDLDQEIDSYLNMDLDIVIISSQLEDIDELRIAARILNNEITQNTPIIIIIEEDDNELLVKALDLGISDYVISPPNKEELQLRVKTQIRRKKFQDAIKSNVLNNVTLANIDSLTGLYNRRFFDNQALKYLNESKHSKYPLSLIIIDLDDFKKINDNYGHLFGDEVLKETAQRLKKSIRSDDILARFGGEEFILLLPKTGIDTACIIAERIRLNIENTPYNDPFDLDKRMVETASFGVSSYISEERIKDFISRADKALYRAKQQGKNKVVIG